MQVQVTIYLYLGAKKKYTKEKENINFAEVFTLRMKIQYSCLKYSVFTLWEKSCIIVFLKNT